MRIILIALALTMSPASAAEYSCGSAILYPYEPVFCPREDCLGQCYSYDRTARDSALLPAAETHCVWADPRDGNLTDHWYRWEPRIDGSKRTCFLSDKGDPHNINDLPRDHWPVW